MSKKTWVDDADRLVRKIEFVESILENTVDLVEYAVHLVKKIPIISWIIVNVGLILAVSWLATGSLNPFKAFTADGRLLKLVLGLLILILAAPIRALFILIIARKAICAKVIPARCGEPVLEPERGHEVNSFMFAATTTLDQSVSRPKRNLEGLPVRCKVCRKWYHRTCVKSSSDCNQLHCPSMMGNLSESVQVSVTTLGEALLQLDESNLPALEEGLARIEHCIVELRFQLGEEREWANHYLEVAGWHCAWAKLRYQYLKADEASRREDWDTAIHWLSEGLNAIVDLANSRRLTEGIDIIGNRAAVDRRLHEELSVCLETIDRLQVELARCLTNRAIGNTARIGERIGSAFWGPPDKQLANLNSAQWNLSQAAMFDPSNPAVLEKLGQIQELLLSRVSEGAVLSVETDLALFERLRTAGKQAVVPCWTVDGVHFTVTSPQSVLRGNPFVVNVWAHLGRGLDAVIRRAREAGRVGEILVESKGPVKVRRGTTLSVRLKIEDLLVGYPEDTILWEGETGNAKFLVRAPHDVGEGSRSGLAKIYLEGLQIARVPFVIEVGRASPRVDVIATNEGTYRKAFASYASADRDQVLPRIQGIQKVAPYLEIFLDVLSLRSGQDWESELWRVIPRSDVFYLFWSDNARKSEWVEKEWRCALDTRGIDFIDPVPLVSPNEAPPPPELDTKHFNDWVLAFMSSGRAPA